MQNSLFINYRLEHMGRSLIWQSTIEIEPTNLGVFTVCLGMFLCSGILNNWTSNKKKQISTDFHAVFTTFGWTMLPFVPSFESLVNKTSNYLFRLFCIQIPVHTYPRRFPGVYRRH